MVVFLLIFEKSVFFVKFFAPLLRLIHEKQMFEIKIVQKQHLIQ